MSTQTVLPVTVVVPARDEESNIQRVIAALLHQTYQPAEIIVADGGSKDRTRDVVKQFSARGEPVRLVEDKDALPGRARNLAIRAARTEWVAMTDAGAEVAQDWIEKLMLETQTRTVSRGAARDSGDCDVVFGSYVPILDSLFRECLALAFVPNPSWIGGRPLRGPSTCSMMIKKSAWESVGGFREDLRACEDLLFFSKLKATGVVTSCAPDALVRWNIPADFAGVFRRFRSYSHHTLKAKLGRTWHVAVAKMYAIGLLFAALSAFAHWAFVIVPVLGLAARVRRSVSSKRQSLPLKHVVAIRHYLLVTIILLVIDLAAFAGVAGFVAEKLRRPKTASEGEAVSNVAVKTEHS